MASQVDLQSVSEFFCQGALQEAYYYSRNFQYLMFSFQRNVSRTKFFPSSGTSVPSQLSQFEKLVSIIGKGTKFETQ